MPISPNIFWFRRDLRLEDNHGLFQAISSGKPLILLFIFDTEILDQLKDRQDARLSFIYSSLQNLKDKLQSFGGYLLLKHGKPLEIWEKLVEEFHPESVFTNHDYEPYAIQRDQEIEVFLKTKGTNFYSFKDQVIFEKDEVIKEDGKPYTVFTPYKRKWLERFSRTQLITYPSLDLMENGKANFYKLDSLEFPSLEELGFKKSTLVFPGMDYKPFLKNYAQNRDFPGLNSTSRISVHLRFGTISIRELVKSASQESEIYMSELIWREFYFTILWHFPRVVHSSFREEYDRIPWLNRETDFETWKEGNTGYPLVDAGMRELKETGFMHNRVRMVVASFLTKHLLIDWKWGEAYFAEKLLDFELSSNNGGWQWAAGSGVDAAPYFRIFNPYEQEKKFDPQHLYIKKWVKEWNTNRYPLPMVDHKFARARCLDTYQKALKGN